MEITNKQIKALREEAMAHSDYTQSDLCDLALSDESGEVSIYGANGKEVIATSPAEARALCAAAIAEALNRDPEIK